ncbi:MAG: [FeFe] hydrogenase H-cluster radical SAM maturase HydE [Ruminococcaceae bacterium]|nr:[FeFe] hydrogenase H-cluster radical SAM maturase HydE [Oscillospiraceae bacterium]
MKQLIERLQKTSHLEKDEWLALLNAENDELRQYAAELAREVRHSHYGKKVYIRGLIEFTNYCKNNCLYCGIRAGNPNAERYRLTKEQILSCCKTGWELGFRTFVLQGGEDPHFTDEVLCDIVQQIKKEYPECAVTLSVGERSRDSYQALFDAGADRYLLRHETANKAHYQSLHPENLTLENRMECLQNLKEIGFQVGCGFMVGSPNQTNECIAEDLLFLEKFQPHMVGIGPFIPHHDTPFAKEPSGNVEKTLYLLSLIRLLLPKVLLPATTALGTLRHDGREQGILAGANVVMPNLSPTDVREQYSLYDNKICTGDEAAECRYCMQRRIESVGYEIEESRGDHISKQ